MAQAATTGAKDGTLLAADEAAVGVCLSAADDIDAGNPNARETSKLQRTIFEYVRIVTTRIKLPRCFASRKGMAAALLANACLIDPQPALGGERRDAYAAADTETSLVRTATAR